MAGKNIEVGSRPTRIDQGTIEEIKNGLSGQSPNAGNAGDQFREIGQTETPTQPEVGGQQSERPSSGLQQPAEEPARPEQTAPTQPAGLNAKREEPPVRPASTQANEDGRPQEKAAPDYGDMATLAMQDIYRDIREGNETKPEEDVARPEEDVNDLYAGIDEDVNDLRGRLAAAGMDPSTVDSYASLHRDQLVQDRNNETYHQVLAQRASESADQDNADEEAQLEEERKRQQEADDNYNETVLIAGTNNERVGGYKPISNTRFYPSAQAQRQQSKNTARDLGGIGDEVSGTLRDDANLNLDSVGVGIETLVQAYLVGGVDIRNLVQKYTGLTPEDLIGQGVNDEAVRSAIRQTFTYENQIRLPTKKDPVSEEASAQSRIVVAHSGSGFYIHPIVHKQYTADFDGDTICVGFDEIRGASIKRASQFFVSSAGKALFDEDFMGINRVFEFSQLENDLMFAMSEKDMANMFKSWSISAHDRNGKLFRVEISPQFATSLAKSINEAYKGQIDAAKGLIDEAPSIYEHMMRSIVNYAYKRYPDSYDEVACTLLKNIYDFAYNVRMIDAVILDFGAQYKGPMALNDAPADERPVEVSIPSPPSNIMDLMAAFSMPIARREGKNVIFRLNANLAKEVKSIIDTAADPSGWISPKQWKSCANDLVSLMMANRVTHRDTMVAANAYLRAQVIKEIGVPDFTNLVTGDSTSSKRYQLGFDQWAKNFTTAWNNLAREINAANSKFTTNMEIIEATGVDKLKLIPVDSMGNPTNLNDMASPFLKIYGEFTMSRMMGNQAVNIGQKDIANADFRDGYYPPAHGNLTLAKWVQVTRYASGSATGSDKSKTAVETGYRGLLRCLADQRSVYSRTFHNELTKALKTTYTQLHQFDNKIDDGDYVAVSEGMLSSVMLLGNEAFDYFGLNTVDGFRMTKFGRKLLSDCIESSTAKVGVEKLGSTWMTILGAYRLDPIMKAKEEWIDARDRGTTSEEGLAAMRRKWENQLDSLAASSDTWQVLVQDFRNNGTLITGTLLSDTKTFTQKCNEIQLAITRDGYDIDRNKLSWEIPAELASATNTMTADNLYMTDFGHGKWLNSFRDLNDRLDSFCDKNIKDIDLDIKKTISYMEANDIQFTDFFSDVKDGKFLLSYVEPEILADSFAVAAFPTYDSSEKNSQEAPTQHAHDSIMLATNGDQISDLQRCDDGFFNKMAADRFIRNQVVLQKLMTDPDFEVEVYWGASAPAPVNQQTLGIGDTHDDIAAWLLTHPRVAMALRRTTFSAGSDDKTYKAAMSLEETIKLWNDKSHPYSRAMDIAINKIKDHPSFYALTALCVPMEGRKQYQVNKDFEAILPDMIKFLAFGADFDKQDWVEYFNEVLLPSIDIEWNDLKAAAKEGDLNWEYGIYGKDQLVDHFAKTMVELSSLVASDPSSAILAESFNKVPFLNRITTSELINYNNQIQHWSGARTATATSVNGSESQRNACVGLLATARPVHDCGVNEVEHILFGDLVDDFETYIGTHLEDGTVIDEEWLDEANYDDYYELILVRDECCQSKGLPCQKHSPEDQSANITGVNTAKAIGAYLDINRSNSAETFSLQAKAKPKDSSDSVIKIDLWDDFARSDFKERKKWVERHVASGDIESARITLANAMMEFNHERKYDQLGFQQYLYIAHLLIRPTDKGLFVLSIEQLNLILEEEVLRLSNDPNFDKNDPEALTSHLAEYLENWSPQGQVDIEKLLCKVQVANQSSFKNRNLLSWNSSLDRNLELQHKYMQAYLNRNGGEAISPTRLAKISLEYEKANYKNNFASYFKSYKYVPADKTKPNAKPQFLEGTYKNKYKLLGYASGNTIKFDEYPGPDISMLVEGWTTSKNFEQILEVAKRNGNTVFIDGEIDDTMKQMLFDYTNGHFAVVPTKGNKTGIVVSFFDLELNGSTPMDGSFNVGEFRYRYNEIMRFVRDEINEFKKGDSSAVICQRTLERITPTTTKREEFFADTLFRRLIDRVDGSMNYQMRLADSKDVIQKLDWEQNGLPDFELGFEPNERQQNQFIEDLQRYITRVQEEGINDDGFLASGRPNDIIGWMIAEEPISEGIHQIWAPIYAFDIYRSGAALKEFNIDKIENHLQDRGSVIVSYSNSSSLLGHTFKIFQSWMAANKLTADGIGVENRQLKNGTYLDAYFNSNSTISRELLSARNNIMSTLIWESRLDPYGYNLAELPTTFPNAPELKEKLLSGDQITIDEWRAFLKNDGVFFSDNQIWNNPQWAGMGSKPMNAWLKKTVEKCIKVGVSPENWLSSRNQKDGDTYIAFRWDVLYDHSSSSYQDCLMAFLHSMNPSLCPEYQLAEYNGELFYPDLRVDVPFRGLDDELHYRKQYIATGMHFLDSHFDGFSGYSVDGSVVGVPALSAQAFGGRPLQKEELEPYLQWALSSRSEGDSSVFVTSDVDDESMVE